MVGDRDEPGRTALHRNVQRRLALPGEDIGLSVQRRGVHPVFGQQPLATDDDRLPVEARVHAPTGPTLERLDRRRLDSLLRGAAHDGLAEGMLAGPFDARRTAQQVVRRESFRTPAGIGDDVRHLGPSAGQGAGLVEDDGRERLHPLEDFPALDEDPAFGPAAAADHDRGRRRQPQRARAGDDEDRDEIHDREVAPRLRPERQPNAERQRGHADDRGHEPRGQLVGLTLDRGLGRLRLAHEVDDPRQRGLRPDLGRAEAERAGRVHGRGHNRGAGPLFHGHAFAGQQGLVHQRDAVQHHAIDRNPLSGSDQHPVADLNAVDCHFLGVRRRVAAQHGRGARLQGGQAAHSGARPRLGRGLQPATDQNQRDDDGRGIEIHLRVLPRGHEEPRREHGRGTVSVGRGRPDRDQRIHVAVPSPRRGPGALVELRADPELNRTGENEQPDRRAERQPRQQRRHGAEQNQHRQDPADQQFAMPARTGDLPVFRGGVHHLEADLCQRDPDRGQIRRSGGVFDQRVFAGQIDARPVDARHHRQCPLDLGHARSAVHAPNADAYRVGSFRMRGHRCHATNLRVVGR